MGRRMEGFEDLLKRVAAGATPPAVYNRANVQNVEDYILLVDLVQSGAYLPEDLKREFLAEMVDEDRQDEPVYESILVSAEDFAAMAPVVDMRALKGQG